MSVKGSHLSEETKQKLRLAKMGNIPWNKGITGYTTSWKGGRHSEETKRKISEEKSGEKNAFWGKNLSDEHKQKIREKHLGTHHTEETKQKIRAINIGKHCSDETKQKMRERMLGKNNPFYGRKHSEETKQKNREYHKRLWQNEEYGKNFFQTRSIKPNGLELYLDFILQNHFTDEWKYVGNGNTIINGLCPDFINVNGKKQIIELFGEYWHKTKRNISYNRTEEGRKIAFKEIGYDTLVIWDHELADEQAVIEKIKEFTM